MRVVALTGCVVALMGYMMVGGCASTSNLPPDERRSEPLGAMPAGTRSAGPSPAGAVAGATPPRSISPVPTGAAASYVVRAHDTLYSIAWRHNLDYRELAKWNNIGSDYKLAIGQVLLLEPGRSAPNPSSPRRSSPQVGKPVPLAEQPREPALVASKPPSAAGGPAGAAPSVIGPPVPEAVPPMVQSAPATESAPVSETEPPLEPALPPLGATKWVWPTDRSSAPRPVPGGGILLLGHLGQDVRAAAFGRVVYTGSGIRGYGNLIIVKHADNLLSSYAHNEEVLVHEGEEVAMGQVIARMGVGPHRVCALYFEIRVNGKPADPLRYLSAAR